MPTVKLGSQAVFYEEHGKGHPLLLIPGLGSTRSAWWKQFKPLSQKLHVIALDNRDAGESSPGLAPYSIADMAQDAAGLLRELDLGPAHVMGWSMGGFIAQELAHGNPGLVEKLILVATSSGGEAHVRPAPEIGALLLRSESEGIGARVRRIYPSLAGPGYMAANPGDLDQIVSHAEAKPMALESYQRQLGAVMKWKGIGHELARLAMPVLVMHGDADLLIPHVNGQRLAASIPNAKLSTYAGVGHLVPIEAPGRFNREVIEFLS
jgi:pimeloyl-ACP methyl ester carboxylesterase